MAKDKATLPKPDEKGMTELWQRLKFLFMALVVYRIGAHIPVPGIDPDRLAALFSQNEGTIVSLVNMRRLLPPCVRFVLVVKPTLISTLLQTV